MKFDIKKIKTNGIAAAEVMGGIVAANAATKLIPIENGFIRNAIPLVLGVAGLATDNKHITSVASGFAAFGALGLINEAVRGSIPTDDGGELNGINGIGDNPMVQKFADLLIPNLGSTESYDFGGYDENHVFDIEDVDYEDVSGMGNIDMPYAGDDIFESLGGGADMFDQLSSGGQNYAA